MSNDFGSILFKPTCSNCGRVLDCDVEYEYTDSLYHKPHIVPHFCPHCKCVFESIKLTIPSNGRLIYSPNIEVSAR